MKIEKLTENKIRIIMNGKDLEENDIDLHTLMTKTLESQRLFLNMLVKAEQEVGFCTDGCRLLIEAFSSTDDNFIFTITKYEKTENLTDEKNNTKKRLTVKRKSIDLKSTHAIFCFQDFDSFCHFCQFLNSLHEFESKKMSKDFSLYCYKNSYYLVASNINIAYPYLKNFYSAISEFGKSVHFSTSFKNKLIEHGKIIIKKNALAIGIKYFCK